MSLGFSQLSNTIKISQDKSMQTTRMTAAQTTNAINRSIQISASGDRQILSAIKAAAAAGGSGGLFGGALGTAKGSLGG